MVHSGPEYIAEQVGKLAELYKNISFILAHSGGSYETAEYNMKIAKKHSNVFLEITFTSVIANIIEYMVNRVTAEKILFGTDIPMRDSVQQLAWVAYARITEEDKIKILGGNMKKLLARVEDKEKNS